MGMNIYIFISLFCYIKYLIVALNFQTGDVSMSLNHGLFSGNNQCGYILKPAILRESNIYYSRERKRKEICCFRCR